MRQTGGLADGEISTKSKPLSSAAYKACRNDNTPAWLPSASIKRTSGTLICSLIRARSLSRLFDALMVESSSWFKHDPFRQSLDAGYRKLYQLSLHLNQYPHVYAR